MKMKLKIVLIRALVFDYTSAFLYNDCCKVWNIYCLVQYFDYMAQKRKKKKWLKCEDCLFRDKCEKRKEQG